MVPFFEQQDDDLKRKHAKNNKAKMVLYNALPKKEYERIFMCKTAKDIWKSLLITHQGNSQVKDNKIDLLVQQYEQFTILEEESIDSSFARFNTIITSLKALDEGFSSKNYVMEVSLVALHPKWRSKVMEKRIQNYRGKKERVKSIALKAKKESSDDETSTSRSDDEEYAMAVRNFKKFFRRKVANCPKPSRNKDHKASMEVLGVDRAKMTPKTNQTMKLYHGSNVEEVTLLLISCDDTSSLDNEYAKRVR
ncbi:hypothetical protein Tco_1509955 [Tanacetum coccineum]